MLRYDMKSGSVILAQSINRPTLYFDQWFWSKMAKDVRTRDAIKAALTETPTTILYSFVTLVELCRLRDERQLDAIMEVADLADYAIIEVEPATVVDLEDKSPEPSRDNPPIDKDLARALAESTSPLKTMQARTLIEALLHEIQDGGRAKYESIGVSLQSALFPTVEKARAEPEILKKAKLRRRQRRDTPLQWPYTRHVFEDAIDYIASNESMSMSRNEWLDLLHTVVPLVYADFVLLDKRWRSFRSQLPEASPPIARAFKPSEIPDFLKAIGQFAQLQERGTPGMPGGRD